MRIFLLSMCVLLLAGCPQQSGQSNTKNGNAETKPVSGAVSAKSSSDVALTVWIDPLLMPALKAIEPEFEKEYGLDYELVAVERGELLNKVAEEGFEPPAIVCADQDVLLEWVAQGQIDEGTLRTFAGDRLVLAERPGHGYKSPTLFDIYELRFEHLGLGESTTLEGYYGEQALISEGVYKRIQDRIDRYPSSVALVDALKQEKVEMVLTTASTAAVSGISAWLVIGEDVHEDIRYQAAAGIGHAGDPGVMDLLLFLAENEDVQLQLEGYGLVNREVALVEDR